MRDVLFIFILTCVHAWIPEDVKRGNIKCAKQDSWRCILRDNVLDCKKFYIQLNSSRGEIINKFDFSNKRNSTNLRGTCNFYKSNRNAKQTKFRCVVLEEYEIYNPGNSRGSCNCHCKISNVNQMAHIKLRRSTVNKITTAANSMACVGAKPIMQVIPSKTSLAAAVKIWYNSSSDVYSDLVSRFLRFPDGEKGNCSDLKHPVVQRVSMKLNKANGTYTYHDEQELNKSGNYCIRVSPRNCYNEHWDCDFTLEDPLLSMSSHLSPNKNKMEWFYILIAILVAISVVALSVILVKYCKKRNAHGTVIITSQHVSPTELLIPNIETKEIFLAYDRRNPDPHEVRLFAELLEKYFFCKVSYETKDERQVIIDTLDYVKKQLETKTVIIINSEDAFQRQNDNARQLSSDQPYLDNVFDIFLGYITKNDTRWWDNYVKLIHVAFEYTSQRHILKHLASDVYYEIPKDLTKLFIRLHSLDGRSSIEKCWEKDEIYIQFCDAMCKAAKRKNFVKETVLNVGFAPPPITSPSSSSTSETPLDDESMSDCESANSRKNLLTV